MVAVVSVNLIKRKWRSYRRQWGVEHVKFAIDHVMGHVEEHVIQHANTESNGAKVSVESLTGRPAQREIRGGSISRGQEVSMTIKEEGQPKS